jgi:hypothetical protein
MSLLKILFYTTHTIYSFGLFAMSSHGGQKRSHGVYISDSGGPLPRHQPAFNPQTAYVPTQQHTGPQTHNGNSGVGLTRTPQPSHREHQPLLHEIYPVAQHAQKRPRHDIVSDSRSHPPIYGPQIGVAPVQWHGGPQAPSVYGNVNSTGVERPLQPQHQQPQHTPPQHPQHQAIQYQHHQPLQHQPLQHQPLQYQPMQYQQSQHQHVPHEAQLETPSANNMPYMGAPHSSHPPYHIAPTLRYALYAVRPMEDDRSHGMKILEIFACLIFDTRKVQLGIGNVRWEKLLPRRSPKTLAGLNIRCRLPLRREPDRGIILERLLPWNHLEKFLPRSKPKGLLPWRNHKRHLP